jgi:Protein of unknown function (DUF1761)
VLGGVWFADVGFGKPWRRSIGWETTAAERLGAAFYLGPLITCLVTTIAVAMLARGTGSDTISEAIVLALVSGVGVAGAVLFVVGALDPRKPEPHTWFLVMAAYHLLALVLVSVIVSVWR